MLLVVVVAIGACTSASDAPAAPPGNPVLVEGREVYINSCANCHGPAGSGGVGSKFNDGRVIERYPDIEEQITLVRNGVRAMPSFESKLSPQQVDAVVRYTRDVLAEA